MAATLLSATGCLATRGMRIDGQDQALVVVEPGNLPADGASRARVTLALRAGSGEGVAGAAVGLTAGDCEVDAGARETDAQGQATWSIACHQAGAKVVQVALRYPEGDVSLRSQARLNVFAPADANGTLPRGTPLSVVAARRAAGRLDDAYRGWVQVTSSDPAARLPAPTYVDGGAHTFFRAALLVTPGAQSLAAVDRTTGEVLSRETFNVAALHERLTLVAQADTSAPTAGAPFRLHVAALAADGAPTAAGGQEVAVLASDPRAELPAGVSLDGREGVWVEVVLHSPGEQTLQVVDATGDMVPAVVGPLSVAAGAAASLRLVLPPSLRAGAAGDAHVLALDALGQPCGAPTGSFVLESSDPRAQLAGPLSLVGDGPIALGGAVRFGTLGSQQVRLVGAADGAPPCDPVTVEVTAGSGAVLDVAAPATAVAGAAVDLALEARGADGERLAGFAGTVRLTASDPGAEVAPPVVFRALDGGRLTVPGAVTFAAAGSASIGAVAVGQPGLSGHQDGIAVAAGPATRLALAALPGVWASGVPETVWVQAVDAYGNRQPGYGGTVALALSDPAGAVPATRTLSAGAATFTATTQGVGAGTLVATDVAGTLAPATLALARSAGPVARIDVALTSALSSQSLSGLTDDPATQARVRAFDAAGNPATGAAEALDIVCQGPPASCPASHSLAPADAGAFTFSPSFHGPGWAVVTVRVRARPEVVGRAAMNIVATPDLSYGEQLSLDGITANEEGDSFAPALALDATDRPVVAWNDQRSGSQIYLVRWLAGAWQELAGSASGGGVSGLTGTNDQVSVAVDPGSGDPAVAWRHADPATGHAAIYYAAYSAGAGAWQARGGSLAAGGISGDASVVQGSPQLIFAGGTPLVAWQVQVGADTVVRALSFDGASWTAPGGTADVSASLGSHNTAPAIAANAAGDVVAAWQSDAAGSPQIYVKRLSGGAWAELAGSASGTGISGSAGAASAPRVGVAADGRVWVAWRDTGLSVALGGAAFGTVRVKSFAAGAWAGVDGSDDAAGLSASRFDALSVDLALAADGQPAVLWTQRVASLALSQLMVARIEGGVWRDDNGSSRGLGTSLGMTGRADGDLLGRMAVTSTGSRVVTWQGNIGTTHAHEVHLVGLP